MEVFFSLKISGKMLIGNLITSVAERGFFWNCALGEGD